MFCQLVLAACHGRRASWGASQTKEGIPLPVVVLTDAVLGLVAQRMQVLSDPVRIRLLLALQDGEASVQELADALDVEHKNASRNLSTMHRDGILTRRRDGTKVLYGIADFTACRLLDQASRSVVARVEELSDLVLQQ